MPVAKIGATTKTGTAKFTKVLNAAESEIFARVFDINLFQRNFRFCRIEFDRADCTV